jgi:hypothetical protein
MRSALAVESVDSTSFGRAIDKPGKRSRHSSLAFTLDADFAAEGFQVVPVRP